MTFWKYHFRKALRFAPSALIFLGGVGAIYLADVLIARFGSTETVANWAVLKSFMMIGGTLAMFGINGLIFREPEAIGLLLRVGIVQVGLFALIAGLFAVYMGWAPTLLIGVVAVGGFAFSNMAFQWLRAELRLTEGYIVNGMWRMLFLVGILVAFVRGLGDPGVILLVSFVLAGIPTSAILLRSAPIAKKAIHHQEIRRVRDVYLVGGSLLLMQLSQAISAYGENLIVHQLGLAADVEIYYKGLIVYLFPGVIFNQYLVAVVGPYIRDNEAQFNALVRRYSWIGWIALAGLVWPILYFGGRILENLAFDGSNTPSLLAALLALTGCVRLYYILPSSYVGILADRRQLLVTSIGYMVCAILLPIVSFLAVALGIEVAVSVALASLLNWTLRSLIGARAMSLRIRKVARESQPAV